MWQIPRNAIHPYGTLIAFVSEETLSSLMNFSRQNGSFYYVINVNDESIVASGSLLGSFNSLDLLNPTIDDSGFLHTADGTTYLIAEASSSVYGLKFVRAFPYQTLLGNLRAEKTKLLMLVFITSFIGILLFAWLSKINYHPFLLLFDMIKSSFPVQSNPSKNELESSKKMLSELLARERINQSVYKAHMIERLLHGRYDSFDVFNMHGTPYLFVLPFPTWRITAISLSGNGSEPASWQNLMTLTA